MTGAQWSFIKTEVLRSSLWLAGLQLFVCIPIGIVFGSPMAYGVACVVSAVGCGIWRGRRRQSHARRVFRRSSMKKINGSLSADP